MTHRGRIACIVQLPFPSVSAPDARVADYYRDYGRIFSELVSGYFVPEAGLWELPLWVAHLAGMLDAIGCAHRFVDLSHTPPTVDACVAALLTQTREHNAILLSPLAQNFDLAVGVSRRLIEHGRVTLLGGNMTALAGEGDASVIHNGQATPRSLEVALFGRERLVVNFFRRGDWVDWLPDYDLLEDYRGQVPLLRLNASHGCLYACDFCGDAWSRQLVLVEPRVLEHEIRQFERYFPEVRLIYVGDKTFGQSSEAVKNLLNAFARRDGYRFIVQTHVMAVDEALVDAMTRLGVVAVELGFESASSKLLRASHKPNLTLSAFADRLALLTRRGIKVVLNLLSGLPRETREDHDRTLDFIGGARSSAWLYNLYNFVPYPLTAQFPALRDRIVDWTFAHWREDGPPVFVPYHVTREQSYAFFLEKVACAHEAILQSGVATGTGRLASAVVA
jgi:uncharacterized radical SAM superfamily protein